MGRDIEVSRGGEGKMGRDTEIKTGFAGNDAILLFDTYGQDSQDLHTSFQLAGFTGPAVVIEDDGFLPEGMDFSWGILSRRWGRKQGRGILMRSRCRNTGRSAEPTAAGRCRTCAMREEESSIQSQSISAW